MRPFRATRFAVEVQRCSRRALGALALVLAAGSVPGLAQTAHYVGVQTTIATQVEPTGIAVDSANAFYIADFQNSRILKEVPGPTGYTQTIISNSAISKPVGVAVDSAGNLYVTNYGASLIKLTLQSGAYTSSVILSGLTLPGSVAVTPDGSAIYMNDQGTAAIYQFAYASGSYVEQPLVQLNSTFPTGLATDATGAWYLLNGGTIQRHAAGFSGTRFSGTTLVTGVSSYARGVALDAAGDLFVADTNNSRILEYAAPPAGSTTSTFSVLANGVNAPGGVAVDTNGVIAFGDQGNARALALNPVALNFGSVTLGATSAAQTLSFIFDTAGTLNGTAPYQALLGGAGNLDYAVVTGSGTTCTASASFTVDAGCTVALTFAPKYPGPRNGAVVLNGSSGAQAALGYVTGNGMGPQAAFAPAQLQIGNGLSYPLGMAVDAAGNVYIADSYNNRVVKEVYSGGTYTQSPTSLGSGLNNPHAVAVDGAGNVYIADSYNNRVVKEVYAGGTYTQSPTSLESAFPSYGVAVDGAGNVYIADTYNDRVVKEVYANGTYTESPSTIGTGLDNPRGLAVDGSGNVYIADFNNQRVVKEVYAGGIYTQSPTPIGSGLEQPTSVALDAAGDVYIAASGSRIVVKELNANGIYTQSPNVIGNGFDIPWGVAVDSSGNVFITDEINDRAVVETVATPPTLTFAATPVFSTSADSPQAMVVSNTGNLDLLLASPITPENFSLNTSTCLSSTLAAGGACPVFYSYTPTTTGPHSGIATLLDTSLNVVGQINVALQGAAATKAAQTIFFPQPAVSGNFLAGTVIALNATSGSGLPVTYSIQAPGVSFGITTHSITLNSGSGTVSITASQSGNSSYNAATNVTDSFTANIVAAPPTGATLPDTAIGSTSTAQVSVQILTAGALGSVQGLLQGNPGLDYSGSTTSGSCALGSALPLGQICTVTVTFTPTYAGVRYGAVQVLDGSGNILGSTFLQASGLGPQVAFAPTQITAVSGLSHPQGVAVDSAGNLYINDTGLSEVVKEVYSGGTYTQSSTPIGSGVQAPEGIAVDGAGNVYVTDRDNGRVYKEAYADGLYTQSVVLQGANLVPVGVAVDGAGNLYVADYNSMQIAKVTFANGTYTQAASIGSALAYPQGVAVDGAGNVYVADTNNNRVVEEVYANGTYTQSSAIGVGLNHPYSVAVDGIGNLYIGDFVNGRIVKLAFANGTYVQSSTYFGNSFANPGGVAVDGAGNVYIGDITNASVLIEKVATPPTLSFPSTATGVTSAPMQTTVTNLGNQPLIFPVPAGGTDPRTGTAFALETNTDTTCPVVQAGGTAGQLAANATCLLSYVFTPGQVGTISSSSILTDNTQNVSGSMQSFGLKGVGTQGTQTAQTITFPLPAAVYPGTAALSATATSGLAVSYTLVSGPATLSGSTLTYTAPGTVVVTANQAGNVQYAAAVPVSISITVTQAIAQLNWQPSTLMIYTGTALDTGILDATDSIPATISYSSYLLPSGTPAAVMAGTVPRQGSYGLTATFTPQDAVRYGVVSDTLLFTVQNMNVFVANSIGTVTSLYNNGTTIPIYNDGSAKPAAVSGGGIGAAVDHAGYVWSINADGGGVSKFDDVGGLVAKYNGVAGINGATALAVDGNGTVWVANKGGSVSALSNGGVAAPVAIGAAANLSRPASITVDPAGSLWIANSGNNTVTEIIGVAAPVTTPLAQSVVNNTVAAKP